MDKTIYTLYLVTERYDMPEESFLDIITTACQSGVTLIQLREKKLSTKEFYELAKKVKVITDRFDIPLIINDRVDICLAVDAAGVHIGDDELPVDITRSILGKGKLLGVSAKNLQRTKEAYEQGADYVGVGAIFPTKTKKNAVYTNIETLQEIIDANLLPVVAIGGIQEQNMDYLSQTHVDGIAMVSEIMLATHVKTKVKTLKEKMKNWRKG